MSTGRKVIVSVLVVIGLIFLAVGIAYIVVKAGSLPSFIPGHITAGHAGSSRYHSKRGIIVIVVGAVVLLIAVALVSVGRPGHRRQRHL